MRLSPRLPFVYPKVKRKMDPIFEHPGFDSAWEKMKRFMRQLVKSQKPLKTRCTLVSNVGATMFSLSERWINKD